MDYGKTAAAHEAKKDGYLFKGWYTDSTLTTKFSFDDVVTKSVSLYPSFVRAYDVEYYKVNKDGTVGDMIDTVAVQENTAPTKPVDPTTVDGAFKGWYTDAAGTTAFDFTKPITGEGTKVYAVFTFNDATKTNAVTIYYKKNVDGVPTDTSEVQNIVTGKTAVAPAAATEKMTGYTFKGWYQVARMEEGKPVASPATFDFSTAINEPVSIMAVYDVVSYTVTFNTNGGSSVAPQTVNHGDKAVAPVYSTITKKHYHNSGEWFTDAKFSADSAFNFNKPIVAPEVAWNGHTLEGWFNDAASATTAYNLSVAPTSDLDLVAHWTANKYTVTFVTNGGTVVDPLKVEAGKTVYDYDYKLWESSKVGFAYRLYKDASFLNPYYRENIYEDTTLYYKWEPMTFDVAFFYDATKQLEALTKYETVEYNATVTEPTSDDIKNSLAVTINENEAKIKGVAGWYTDTQLRYAYDFTAPVTQDLKLYAKFLDAVNIDLNVKTKAYDGKPIAPEVRVTCAVSADPVPAYKLEYKVKGADDSTYTETAPVAVGSYVARVTVAAAEKTAAATKVEEFSITKIDVTLEWPTLTALVFNGNEQAPVPTVKGALEGETVEVIITGKQSKVGTGYKAVASLPADSNYKLSATAVTECEFSIVENTTAPEVTVNTDAAGVPTSLTVKNADGTTTEVPLTGNDIFTVESKVNEDGTTTMTISAKPGSGYNFAPIVTTVAAPVIPATKLTKVTPGKKRATVTWEAAKDIEGYEIEYGLKKTAVKTKTVKDPAATSLVIKKLKKGKKYFFRIRAYKTVNGTKLFSKWSAWKKSKKIK